MDPVVLVAVLSFAFSILIMFVLAKHDAKI